MIKISIFLTRRADLTHEEFVEYWTHKHLPLIASMTDGSVPVRRHVLLLPTDDEIPGLRSTYYDGVVEVWFDDIADATRWFTSDIFTTTVAADEEKFLDRSLTRFLFTTETPIAG
ncbi:EthD domain-containing protein [Streptomyces sp. NRRL B-1677]|uniref:EthD domain-containing protein n=1 Tax=Streptomyces sp. NRRL B-1677 TaxID=2682966 RepID=UPI001892C4CA|nr:EthD domain-containing protein [Streptomyces sp. NRRL B-1677]